MHIRYNILVSPKKILAHLLLGLITLGLVGCSTMTRNAVPISLISQVSVVGLLNPQIRAWGDEPLPQLEKLSKIRRLQIRATRPHMLHNTQMSFLALSGGGADGAYGAGFLNGWTARKNRPEFEVVTGVSTGALIAPFAFLGSKYDRQLREIFTHYSTKDLISPNLLGGLLGGSAVSSTEPMYQLISHYIDRHFLNAVAHEYRKGRRLLIGTTNLDAGRPVIWNMGLIANQNSKHALTLFRKIILASASFPGVFPPVYIPVTVNGKKHNEMHVDGGTTDNLFLFPNQKLPKYSRNSARSKLYVLVNSQIHVPPTAVKASAFKIAERSTSILIKQQTSGDLLKLYLNAKKNGIGFNYASVPLHFTQKSQEAFDKDYMNNLYQIGYNEALSGYQWRTNMPLR